ncbi:hypothetical protein P0G10_19535, partial [Eubacteriales bacterium DFI.9.88]|nr:hypothetical protein [Eubacteriales bacterium DFI.9.88]
MLSRAEAGLRGGTLIVNLPGSEKAAKECLAAVIKPIKHGIDVLRGSLTTVHRCIKRIRRAITMAKIKAVCISEKKGEQKHQVDRVELKIDHGIEGDAHAGNWHRQV